MHAIRTTIAPRKILSVILLVHSLATPTSAAPPAAPNPALRDIPAAQRPIRVAIYEGAGSQESGIRDVERGVKLLKGATIERLSPHAFAERDLSEFDVVVFSAGGASIQARALGDANRDKVRRFVHSGGAYLGICAGAYLACAEFDWGLKLIAAETLSDRWQRGVGDVQMQLTPEGRSAFGAIDGAFPVAYENGPVIGPIKAEGLPPYRTLATFTTELAENDSPPGIMTGSPAVAEGTLGQGRVMVFSPHPERTKGLERFVALAINRLTTRQTADGDRLPSGDKAVPRTDENSKLAHQQLLEKKSKGRIDLYFLGDSITRRWGAAEPAYAAMLANWRQNFQGYNAANFGWGGDTTGNILWRLEHGELDGVRPKLIVLQAGTNNVGAGGPETDPDDVTRGIKAIIDRCREQAPNAVIILTAVFPRNDKPELMQAIKAINARLEKLADGKQVRWLDVNNQLADADGKLFEGVTTDGLHLSVEGYQIWADALKPVLKELLGPPNETDEAPPPTGDPSAMKK
jgi:lysophospholipase L1-like esterase